MEELLRDLNPAQKEAVTYGNGPLLIVAGAGTGKTTVITRRVAWLISQKLAKPEEILALTFTDKAATEMEERIDRALPLGFLNTWVLTFHAFGERVLRDWGLEAGLPTDFRLLTPAQQWMLVYNNLERFELDYYRPLGNPTRFIHALLQHFSRAKDEEIWPEDYLKHVEGLKLDRDLAELDGHDEKARLYEVANAYHVYQQLLLEKGVFDFGDLINYTLKLLRTRPRARAELNRRFKYILVDEFQDTNFAQYELCKLLAAPKNNLTVVGDDDQAIYKFRGASISNILAFKKDFPTSRDVLLIENYRSTQNILDLSYKFIQQNNPYRLEVTLGVSLDNGKAGNAEKPALSKQLKSARDGAGEIQYIQYHSASEEAEGVIKKMMELSKTEKTGWSDFAILLRANASAPVFLQALKRHGIPFTYVANRGLYFEPIVLEILGFLRVLDNPENSDALYQVFSRDPFKLPHQDLVALAGFARMKAVSLISAANAAPAPELSAEGQAALTRFFKLFAELTIFAREHTVSELYIKVVRDLGIEERVAHPALERDAQYLVAFYRRIEEFIRDAEDKHLHAFLEQLELELSAGEEGTLPSDAQADPDTVKVITVHSAKGLQWRYVFLPHLIDRRFPSTERREPIELPRELIKETLPEGDVHLQEERRLFYVAMTRARDGIFFSCARDYSGKTARKPSLFLHELGFVEKGALKSRTKIVHAMPQLHVKAEVSAMRYTLPEQFSFSSVSAFKKCPLEYKFRHLLKLPGPGAGQLSFGVTIHKTLEEFLKLWVARQRSAQGNLFADAASVKPTLPAFTELKALYEKFWIDNWYASAQQKKEYKEKSGPRQLKNFYDTFIAAPPTPKYLEAFFKVSIGPHKFVGKIDRIDSAEEGSIIIDYKTGATTREKLNTVDREQLIIYQIAAREFLDEKIKNAVYWYLDPNEFSGDFVATEKQMESVRGKYTEEIDKIVETIKTDSFSAAHETAQKHDCQFAHLA
ncbi:ATP-dependent helicase [Candidatus Uhrbacteria bacterium]|nr:ATP-dependent helicase [Candidatus Uhrbacteria bacterium]